MQDVSLADISRTVQASYQVVWLKIYFHESLYCLVCFLFHPSSSAPTWGKAAVVTAAVKLTIFAWGFTKEPYLVHRASNANDTGTSQRL